MEMLAMGKYGAYVWTSFGITVVVLIICVVQARKRHKMVLTELETRLRAMETQ